MILCSEYNNNYLHKLFIFHTYNVFVLFCLIHFYYYFNYYIFSTDFLTRFVIKQFDAIQGLNI